VPCTCNKPATVQSWHAYNETAEVFCASSSESAIEAIEAVLELLDDQHPSWVQLNVGFSSEGNYEALLVAGDV
jgi:hypothetical protein